MGFMPPPSLLVTSLRLVDELNSLAKFVLAVSTAIICFSAYHKIHTKPFVYYEHSLRISIDVSLAKPLPQSTRRTVVEDLPEETLRDIFALSKSLHDSPTRFAARVASVSRRWRCVALGQSELWATLSDEWPLEMLLTWIERVGKHRAIDVILCSKGPDERLEENRSLLFDLSSQWKITRFRLEGCGSPVVDCRNFSASWISSDHLLSELEYLEMNFVHDPIYSLTVPELSQKLPKLRKLYLHNVQLRNLITIVPQLQVLSLSNLPFSPQDWRSLLKELGNLHSLKVQGCPFSQFVSRTEYEQFVSNPIILPSLLNLFVSHMSPLELGSVFAPVRTPSLSELRLRLISPNTVNPGEDDPSAEMQFATKQTIKLFASCPRLRILILQVPARYFERFFWMLCPTRISSSTHGETYSAFIRSALIQSAPDGVARDPFRHLRTLYVEITPGLDLWTVEGYFRFRAATAAPRLRQLVLVSDCLSSRDLNWCSRWKRSQPNLIIKIREPF